MSTSASVSDLAIEQALRIARTRFVAGGETPLDAMVSQFGQAPALTTLLERVSGVKVLAHVSQANPDFSRWPAAMARLHRCVVVRCAGTSYVACEDPWNVAVMDLVSRSLGSLPSALLCRHADFEALLAQANEQQTSMEPQHVPEASGGVVQFVDEALNAAIATGASDIHFECSRQGVHVKFRLDGVLVAGEQLDDARLAEEVVSRLKVLAKLDITERRLPQDGRFRAQGSDAGVDVRVSVMPSVHGEDVVLRLLDKAQLRGGDSKIDLDRLGFDGASVKAIRALAQMPSGLLLVTGPTGSGKTTTVYAALSEINTGIEKIITIEDPVEYELAGVLQVPVNDRKGLTFAKGLRSILRHDPDRLLVGEIRDDETAAIAVQSALTGHLVFTTVHANNLSDVIGRFRHFGIDMFGFMSSLNGVVVQRLLRKVCEHCRQIQVMDATDSEWLERRNLELPSAIVHHVGCSECRGTGYRGRIVVAEVHEVGDGMRDLVTSGAPVSALKAHSRQGGVLALDQQACARVEQGITTLAEVRRVIG
jgi:general secretion pathway protein E